MSTVSSEYSDINIVALEDQGTFMVTFKADGQLFSAFYVNKFEEDCDKCLGVTSESVEEDGDV